MVLSIVEFLDTKKVAIDKIVDTTSWLLMQNQDWLNRYFPMTSYADTSLLTARFTHKPVIASLIAPGAELPIHKPSATMTTQELGHLLVGMEHLWNAKDRGFMKKLGAALMMGGMNAQSYLDHFFGTVDDVQMACYRMVTYLACMVAQTGEAAYTSPLTNVKSTISYTGNIEATLFPAALTGGDRWSQLATATGLEDLEALNKAFFTIHGYYPNEIGIPRDNYRDLCYQASTKRAMIFLITGHETTVTPSIDGVQVTGEDLTRLFASRLDRLPNYRILEGDFYIEQKDGTFTKTPYWAEDKITFFTDGMGEQALVPFPENNEVAGLFINNERLAPQAPYREVLQGMTATIPFVSDARLLASQVIDGAV